jgi:hypothetical protein
MPSLKITAKPDGSGAHFGFEATLWAAADKRSNMFAQKRTALPSGHGVAQHV